MGEQIQNATDAQIPKKHAKTSKAKKEKLIAMVMFEHKQIKVSAAILGINYSTAKGIIQKYKKDKLENAKQPNLTKPCSYKVIEATSQRINLVCTFGLSFQQQNEQEN